MTELTQADRDLFRRAIGVWNRRDLKDAPAVEQLDAGDDILSDGDIVIVRNTTAADQLRIHGTPHYLRTFEGREIISHDDVQFVKGKPRGTLFYMEFDGIAAGYYTAA